MIRTRQEGSRITPRPPRIPAYSITSAAKVQERCPDGVSFQELTHMSPPIREEDEILADDDVLLPGKR